MACNCSKNRTSPTGSGARQASQQQTQREGAQRSAFELRTTDGKTSTHGSRLEASAARARAGGGDIRPI